MDTFNYVGFIKKHPHDNYSLIRLYFKTLINQMLKI